MLNLSRNGVADGVAVMGDIDHVSCAFAPALPRADVDDGASQERGFPDTGGRVTNKTIGAPQDRQKLVCW
jgi:hypothetical protein